LIVIWNALILHARWGGLARPRGMAVLAIFGNIVTAWSWFGVNLLGVGLHAYGFMSGAVAWLSFFVITQLVLIGIGCVPTKYWRSYGTLPPKPPVKPDRRPRDKPDGPRVSTSSPRKVEEGITAGRR
jgi:hypothetical protein